MTDYLDKYLNSVGNSNSLINFSPSGYSTVSTPTSLSQPSLNPNDPLAKLGATTANSLVSTSSNSNPLVDKVFAFNDIYNYAQSNAPWISAGDKAVLELFKSNPTSVNDEFLDRMTMLKNSRVGSKQSAPAPATTTPVTTPQINTPKVANTTVPTTTPTTPISQPEQTVASQNTNTTPQQPNLPTTPQPNKTAPYGSTITSTGAVYDQSGNRIGDLVWKRTSSGGMEQMYEPLTETPEVSGSLSSSSASADINNTVSGTNSIQQQLDSFKEQQAKQLEEEKKLLDEAALQEEKRIKQDQADKLKSLEEDEKSSMASEKALNFKLGRAGTIYASEEERKLADAYKEKKNLIAREAQDQIDKARTAIRQKKYDLAKEYQKEADTKFNQLLAISKEERAMKSESLSNIISGQTITKNQQAQEENTANSIAPSIADSFTGNPEEDARTLQNYAYQYNLDPATLYGSIMQYNITKQKNINDIAKSLPVGQTTTLADGTIIKGLYAADPNVSSYDYKDPKTNTTWRVTVDKATGKELYRHSMGQTYKPEATGKSQKELDDEADKIIKEFQNDTSDLIVKLDAGDVSWSAAYNSMKAKYPGMENDNINNALGGGIPYDPKTGTFDTSAAWGYAKTKK